MPVFAPQEGTDDPKNMAYTILAVWIALSTLFMILSVRADVSGQSGVTYAVNPAQPIVGQSATVTAMLTVPPWVSGIS
jgi:hypothetical protein